MIKDLSQDEAGRWFEAAPAVVQELLGADTFDAKMEELGKKYSLHVDTTGTLAKLTSYLLIGYINPQQFGEELKAAGIDQATTGKIMDDINMSIFKPLSQKMRSSGSDFYEQPVPEAPVPITPVIAKPAPPEVKAPTVQVPPVPKPTPPVPANLPGTPLAEALSKAGVPIAKPAPAPVAEKLLADHEEPHIELMPKPAAPVMPSPPPPAPPVRPVVTTGLPPLPSMPTPQPAQPKAPAPPTPAKPEMRVVGETPPAQRPGGILDPYREPIE